MNKTEYTERFASHPRDVKDYDTALLREEFLIESVFEDDKVKLTYSGYDRFMAGGAVPKTEAIKLEPIEPMKAAYFCERRELGIINIGGNARIFVDGTCYELGYKEALYVTQGSKEIVFGSMDAAQPAMLYLNSAPAHKAFISKLIKQSPHTPWLPDKKFKGKTLLGAYGDFISQVDDAVAQIINTLKLLKIEDNTIVIFSSDNGGHWEEDDIQAYAHQSNYGRRGQKGDIWDGGHHVPLIIQWPALIRKKFTYSQTVGLVDLMATFSEITGQPVKKTYGEDSFSFYKVLKEQSNTPVRDQIIYMSSRGNLAIQKDGWKYIDCLGSGGFTGPGKIQAVKGGLSGQLYNVDKDPLEMNNLYLLNTPKVKELSELLNQLKTQGFNQLSAK